MTARKLSERPLVALRGARHEVMIGRPVHAGGTRSTVAAQKAHARIVTAPRPLVAPDRSHGTRELWETSRNGPAIPI
jgi:hypothetical protein